MRSRLRHKFNSTFGAVHSSRNYRIYLIGQSISLCGTWMQTVAQAWLVLKLTGSGTALGFVVALQFLPVLIIGPWGGVVADRMSKRKLLLMTQVAFGGFALLLGVLTATGVVTLWMVYAVALCFGCVTALDNPARQTFVLEMVGREHLPNAVTLNTVNINMARVIGPALAGITIGLIGIAPCFFVNAASYIAVIVALLMMNKGELRALPAQPRAKGQLREGFQYVWSTPRLRTPLVMMAVVGTLAYEFQVILPLVAKYTFNGNAATYGIMTGAMGLGAVIGGLFTASRQRTGDAPLIQATLVFGALIITAALMPTLPVMVLLLVGVGAGSVTFLARANSTMQLRADPVFHSRVMALWAVAFLGTTPIGGPIIGWIGQNIGPRFGMIVGGTATVLAGIWGWYMLDVRKTRTATAAPMVATSPQAAEVPAS
ncbi:MAG TPA: MFS transporter [Acidimicrobiales bacterium]|nr:MFS transporter [Acidimicrobiales bacterium]